MNTRRILLTSCAALITLTTASRGQIALTGNLTSVAESGGALNGGADLALTGLAFADGLILDGALAPTHTVPNVNNGSYGNGSSWIGGSYVGLSWGNVGQTIQSIAFGRDNSSFYGDRNAGLYTIQYTLADLSTLSIPTTGSTAGITGAAANGLPWVTLGTINLQYPDVNGGNNPTQGATRHQFDLGFSLTGVTGIRIIAPGGADIDEIEVYARTTSGAAQTSQLEIAPAAGYTIRWDGSDGAYYNAADPATIPSIAGRVNLALPANGGTAFATSAYPAPAHSVAHLNDGIYGNANSWLGAATNDHAGVTFDSARHVGAVAWGRDNGNTTGSDCCDGQATDRALGIYTLQSLDPTDGTTWLTLGTFNYKGRDDGTIGAGFTDFLRHEYSLALGSGAITSKGLRLLVPDGDAIDELEIYGSTMGWTNAAGTGVWSTNGDANFSGAADGKFLAYDGVNFGEAGAGTVTISGMVKAGAVNVNAAANYVFAGTGGIGGTASVTKAGTGMLTVSGAQTYSGATTVNGGTLNLNFAAAGAPAANLLNNTGNNSALVLGGARLLLTGKANATNAQQFAGTTLQAGAATIELAANATANPLSLDLGAVTRQTGATLDVILPTGAASASNGVKTSSGAGGTILTDNGVAYATIGGADWVAQAVGQTNLVGLSTIAGGYTASTATSLAGNANVAAGVDTTLAAGGTVTSLRFAQNEGRTVTIGGGQTLDTGGILITPNVATTGSAINGGTLRGAAGRDLVVWQNSAQPFAIGAVIADNGSATGLTKAGSGTLGLSGVNAFTGNVQVSGGALSVEAGGSLTNGPLGANTAGRTVTIAPGATLISTVTDAVDFQASTTNSLAFKIQGTWENNPGNTAGVGFQRTDNLTLQGAVINDRGQHGSDFGGILMNGVVNVSGNAPSTYNQLGGGLGLGVLGTTFKVADVTGNAAPDFIVNGAMRNTPVGIGNVTKLGDGTMVLNGANSYTGITAVMGGKLSLQGAAVNPLAGIFVGNGATLAADVVSGSNRHDITGNVSLAGGTLAGNGNIGDSNTGHFLLTGATAVFASGNTMSTISAEVHLNGAHTFNVADGTAPVDLLVTGALSHFHTVAWGGAVKAGAGTMKLASSMDGTDSRGINGIYGLGGFQLAGGTLIFSGSLGYSAFAPASKSGFFLADFTGNATLKWDTGNTFDPSVNGNLRIGDGVTASLDTNGNNVALGTGLVGGALNSGGLTKAGLGTLTLTAASGFTGATTVNGGTLTVAGSLSGTSAVAVADLATLMVNGTINLGATATVNGTLGGSGTLGPVVLGGTGKLAPGNGIGVIHTGALTLQGGSSLNLEVGMTTGDQVMVNGAITLGGAINLGIALTADPQDGTQFTILNGTSALLGLGSGQQLTIGNNLLDQNEQFHVETGLFAQDFTISYSGDGGNDVILTAVPEPTTVASLLGGLGLLLARRRRRG